MLARRWLSAASFFAAFDFLQAARDHLDVGLVPELMPEAHGDAPMGHGAVRVVFGDLEEFLFGFFVPEGVEQSDSAGEGLLHRRGAGDGEVDGAELRLGEVFVVMVMFVFVVGERGECAEEGEEQQPGKTLHERTPRVL